MSRHLDALLPHGSPARRFARGAAWSVGGSIASQAVGLAALVLVARILGTSGYGELGIVRSTVGMLAAVGTGLSLAVTKHVAASLAMDRPRVGRIVWVSTAAGTAAGALLAGLVLLVAEYASSEYLNAPALAPDLKLGAGLLVFSVLGMVQNGALAGLEAFRAIARINLVRGIAGLPVICGLALQFGVTGAIGGLVAMSMIACVLGELAIRGECAARGIRRSRAGWVAELPALWKISAVLFLCDLVGPPAMWVANALLVQQDGGYSEMGVFSAGSDWLVVAMAVPSLVTGALLPVSSGLSAGGGRAEFAAFARRALAAITVLSVAISLALVVCVPVILRLYGGSFSGHFDVLALLLTAAALGNVSGAMRALAISADHHRGVLASFVAFGVAMVATMILLPSSGAAGRAIAHLVASVALFAGLLLVNAGLFQVGPKAWASDRSRVSPPGSAALDGAGERIP